MIVEDFREYLADILREGYSVRHDEHGSDPDLIDPGGNPVETWRADYPYEERMERDHYEDEKYALQIELLKFQDWAQETGSKHVILFEGRDAAGQRGDDQALHGAPQPASGTGGGAHQADGDRTGPVVFPPLRLTFADCR